MLFRVMNPHQRCLQAKVKCQNEPKQVMPKSEDLSRSLEINAIWTFDTEILTIFNKSCTYITLLYLEHLVPLPLLDFIICPFLDYYTLSIFHNLGSPLSYHTLIFDLMSSRNMYLYNAYIYTYILFQDCS